MLLFNWKSFSHTYQYIIKLPNLWQLRRLSHTTRMAESSKQTSNVESNDCDLVFELRDRNKSMIEAWTEIFGAAGYLNSIIHVSRGDIFQEAPSADAIVSPANSFGFMDGGIDAAYTRHFGEQMQDRLQTVIRNEHDGEILVGAAVILPTTSDECDVEKLLTEKWSGCNDNQPLKWLISAPTMRVPQEIPKTVNPYLAFRAVILAVQKHNKNPDVTPIRRILSPGLGTAVGKMPHRRCAHQMLEALEVYALNKHQILRNPQHLEDVWSHQESMIAFTS